MTGRRALCLAFALVACTPQAVDLGSNDPGPGSLPTDLEARCAAPFVAASPPATDDAFLTALTGTWARCRGDSTAASPLQYPGLQFVNEPAGGAQGPWYGLQAADHGFARDESTAAQGLFLATAPVSVDLQFENLSQTTLVLVFDESGQGLHVVRRFVDSVDVRYVRAP